MSTPTAGSTSEANQPGRAAGHGAVPAGHGVDLEDATYQRGFNRINPQMQDEQQAISQRLVNSGLPVGSEAYNREMDRFEQSSGNTLNDLWLWALSAPAGRSTAA